MIASTLKHIDLQVISCEDNEEIQAALLALNQTDTAENWLVLGNAYCKAGQNMAGIDCYSRGLALDPENGLLWRERAHRYVNTWQFAQAVTDSAFAVRYLPDDWQTWYHGAMALYMLGEYAESEPYWVNCISACKTEDEKLPAYAWLWRVRMMLGKRDEAAAILPLISPDVEYTCWHEDYYDLLMLLKGLKTRQEVENKMREKFISGGSLDLIYAFTVGYSLANLDQINGQTKSYLRLLEMVYAQRERKPATFGCHAAVCEYLRNQINNISSD